MPDHTAIVSRLQSLPPGQTAKQVATMLGITLRSAYRLAEIHGYTLKRVKRGPQRGSGEQWPWRTVPWGEMRDCEVRRYFGDHGYEVPSRETVRLARKRWAA